MAFSFTESLRWKENGTEHSVMLLLRDRAQAGELDVKGIIEASSRSGVKPLLCAGLNIRQDGNPDVMHHKVFIFDEAIVAMGSFNFSNRAANENDENMLIIHNPDIARAYLEEFDRLWAEAGPIPASVTADCG
jgi:phosphatidylserine/phosphatidylglycerophosphate/cardiolipin synthase-like enzyme